MAAWGARRSLGRPCDGVVRSGWRRGGCKQLASKGCKLEAVQVRWGVGGAQRAMRGVPKGVSKGTPLRCWQVFCSATNGLLSDPFARLQHPLKRTMPPPSTVVCEICGGKFSKHSLIIHQRQCVEKREKSTACA